MLKKSELPYCPVTTTINIIGSKWKIILMQRFESRPWRFNELLRDIRGISRRVLSDSLKSMEMDGILTRTVYPDDHFQHVEYSLSELGKTLVPVLREMEKWGLFYKDYYNH